MSVPYDELSLVVCCISGNSTVGSANMAPAAYQCNGGALVAVRQLPESLMLLKFTVLLTVL